MQKHINMTTNHQEIVHLLTTKSCMKQEVYKVTENIFQKIREQLIHMQNSLAPMLEQVNKAVEIKFSEKGPFELHFKFSGDTLVFMMHTNVFTFPENHYIKSLDYVKKNSLNGYCGLIQVYNFLSDSIKYNREEDLGLMVARIFINKEKHFFVEGRRPMSIKHNNFDHEVLEESLLIGLIEEMILYSLKFDLISPPIEMVQHLSVEQKNYQNYSSGFATNKDSGIGFKFTLENP